jgi:hypothetical protein
MSSVVFVSGSYHFMAITIPIEPPCFAFDNRCIKKIQTKHPPHPKSLKL